MNAVADQLVVALSRSQVGKACLSLPFDLSLCRLVWLSVHWGCAADGVILACSLSVQDVQEKTISFSCGSCVHSRGLAERLQKSKVVQTGPRADRSVVAITWQDPFSSPSAFTCPDLVELGQKLRRSNASRRKFDAGRASQPLALRELFKDAHLWLCGLFWSG